MDLNQLFKWKGELVIKDKKGEPVIVRKHPLTLYQRVLGDADLTTVRKKALKASRKLRRELLDLNSDAHLAMIPEYETMDDTILRNAVILSEALEIRRLAIDTVQEPKEPRELTTGASLEEQEDYEEALEKYRDDLNTAINERSTEIMQHRSEELTELDRDALVEAYTKGMSNALCRTEMVNVYNSWCAYLGTFSDKATTKRAFKSYQEFDNVAPELKGQVISGYLQLEVEGNDLKN